MLKSMTGFGRAQGKIGSLTVLIEVKSVNHRYLDCNIRSPRLYEFLEDPVKQIVSKSFGRGKVDVTINIDRSEAMGDRLSLNRSMAEGVMGILDTLVNEYGLRDDRTACSVARFPEVVEITKVEENEEELLEGVKKLAQEAVAESEKMRITEGNRLGEDILSKIDLIENIVGEIEEEAPKRVDTYRERLYTKMKEVLESTAIDDQRILQEAALYADKVAIDEETVRLHSHFMQLRSMLTEGGSVGRKIDFLIQEMNRETNTIGSKSNDIVITKKVVDIKSEIEKIREQVQNIE